MPSRRRISTGVFDSGLSSAGTLLTTLYAARSFSFSELGAYAVFFSGFVLCAGLVNGLVHTPVEVAAVQSHLSPLRGARRSIAQGIFVGFLLGAVLVLISLFVARSASWDVRLQLGLPVLILGALSPAQDHLRRLLHSAERSGIAARLSLGHFVTVLAVLALSAWAHLEPVLVPGLALVLGNVVSLTAGLVWCAGGRHTMSDVPLRLHEVLARGRWLGGLALLSYSSPFLVVLLLTQVLELDVVGEVEAVRILGQPLLVLSAGVQAVIGPTLYRAAGNRDLPAARREGGRFAGAMLACGAVYSLLVAVPWSVSPLPELFPASYRTPGLLAAGLLPVVLQAAAAPLNLLAVGGGQQRALVAVQAASVVVAVAAACTAPATGAFAAPLAALAIVLTGLVLLPFIIRRAWARAPSAEYTNGRTVEP